MNILVLGNGFDLAHGLPTKYTHFLEFVKIYEECYQKEIKDSELIKADSEIKRWIRQLFNLKYNAHDSIEDMENQSKCEDAKKLIDELHKLIKENFWIDYFLQNPMYQKENWIDFESEISRVIQIMDDARVMINKTGEIDFFDYRGITLNNVLDISNKSLYDLFSDIKSITQFIASLNMDLLRLIRALEIYLSGYIGGLDYGLVSPDIEDIVYGKTEDDTDYEVKILSFNYSSTFERLYNKDILPQCDYHYIHGRAKINNTIESNNMVLGIDEYLSDERKNIDTEFIAFKKFYQRIFKGTGLKYKEWVDKIDTENHKYKDDLELCLEELKENKGMGIEGLKTHKRLIELKSNRPKHNIYIFGHSFDVTDRDILRDLILNDNVYTTIFYHNREELGRKIANLVKVIGQDELIRRTGGSTKTIEFKQQRDMVPIKG